MRSSLQSCFPTRLSNTTLNPGFESVVLHEELYWYSLRVACVRLDNVLLFITLNKVDVFIVLKRPSDQVTAETD